jgi:gas vesicle protein
MNRLVNFLAGFFMGAVLGAAGVLLTTPHSGDEFRVKARVRFDEALTEGRDVLAARRSELQARVASLKGGGLTPP